MRSLLLNGKKSSQNGQSPAKIITSNDDGQIIEIKKSDLGVYEKVYKHHAYKNDQNEKAFQISQ